VGKELYWCLVGIVVLLPVCSKNLRGTVPLIPVEKKIISFGQKVLGQLFTVELLKNMS
jgi:hypothetical protein